MSTHVVKVGTLTIPIGTALSNVLSVKELRHAKSFTFHNPAEFSEVISVVGGPTEGLLIAALVVLKNEAVDVTLTADRIQRWEIGSGIEAVGLNAAGNEAAERIIEVYAELDI